MNKSTLKYIGIIIVILYSLKIILSVTGVFRVIKNATIANSPNILQGDYNFVSSLSKINRGDFILYKRIDSIFGEMECIHRVCGIEGDLVEIKSGELYLNNKIFDKKINLSYSYSISEKIFQDLTYEMTDQQLGLIKKINDSTTIVYIDRELAKKFNIENRRIIIDKSEVNYQTQKVFKMNWNKDNFGPVKIPNGKYFLLGDNRDFTIDSRTEGLIDIKKVLGKVLK